jgi:hypothetical protein
MTAATFAPPVVATAGATDPSAPLVAWFANRGIGRPVADSPRSTLDWFRDRLDGLSVLVAQGDGDHVIPRELLDRTWDYLRAGSGAATVAHRQPGGHQLTAEAVRELGDWIAELVRGLSAGPAPARSPRASRARPR